MNLNDQAYRVGISVVSLMCVKIAPAAKRSIELFVEQQVLVVQYMGFCRRSWGSPDRLFRLNSAAIRNKMKGNQNSRGVALII